VEVITGVEVRASALETKVEILGYFVDLTDSMVREMLKKVRGFRRTRDERLVENAVRETGVDLTYDELRRSADGNLGRPHIAERLVETAVVGSVQEAFDAHLAADGDAFVPMERLATDRIIAVIHAVGGVTSLAHPGRIRADTPTVESLDEDSLDAIEVWYSCDERWGSAYADIDDALALAEGFDLVPTGGSDCHGPDSGNSDREQSGCRLAPSRNSGLHARSETTRGRPDESISVPLITNQPNDRQHGPNGGRRSVVSHTPTERGPMVASKSYCTSYCNSVSR